MVTIAGLSLNRSTAEASSSGTVAKDIFGDPEGRVRGWNAAVHRRLQKDLSQLVDGYPIAKGAAQVQLQLFRSIEGHRHRHADAASGAPVETGARPDLAPGVAGDQVLKVAGQGRRAGLGAIDMVIAKNVAADFHPALAPLVVACVPPSLPGRVRVGGLHVVCSR